MFCTERIVFDKILLVLTVALTTAGVSACGSTSGPPNNGSTDGAPPPTYVGDVDDFYAALAQRESSGDPSVENTYGYLGLYQMGEPAMMDAKWYDETAPAETSANDWIGAWLARAQDNGVFSKN